MAPYPLCMLWPVGSTFKSPASSPCLLGLSFFSPLFPSLLCLLLAMSVSPTAATAAAEYSRIKDAITFAYNTYATIILPKLTGDGKTQDSLVHATLLGESTARLSHFVPNLLADPLFFNMIFNVRSIFEHLNKHAKANGLPFTMPPCYTEVRLLTKQIHEFREGRDPAVPSLPAVINAASSATLVPSVMPAPSSAVPQPLSQPSVQPSAPVASTAAKAKAPCCSSRRTRAPKSPAIVDSGSDDDDVQIVVGDVAMAPCFVDALHGIMFLFMQMSVDPPTPVAILDAASPSTLIPTVAAAPLTGLKFSKTSTAEPAIESTDATKAQVRYLPFGEVPGLLTTSPAYLKAIHFAKRGFEESRKRQRLSDSGLDYIKVPSDTKLASPLSAVHLDTAAAAVAGASVTDLFGRAQAAVAQGFSLLPTADSLMRQEVDLRSEMELMLKQQSILRQVDAFTHRV
ncbi:hypothetical protein EV361DRAFT_967598 [Lentinula raphanica]|nr:hypothetical protein EV361DRAFT_967598 [Lentinula raphanica]